MTLTQTRQVVLCVDDEPAVLSALRRLLRDEPYEILTAESPQEALELVRSRRIGLVVADHRLGDVSGAELLRRVREISPRTARVLLTGYPDTASILGRMQHGIQRLITKPWRDEDLRGTIRELLEVRDEPWIPPRHPAIRSVPAGPDVIESVFRVDGADRTTAEIRLRLLPLLRDPEIARRGVVLFIDSLESLNDPPVPFLRTLAETVETENVSATIVETSGLAAAIADRRGPRLEIVSPVSRPLRVALVGPDFSVLADVLRTAGHAVETPASTGGLDLLDPEAVLVDLDRSEPVRPMGRDGREVVALCTCSALWDRATLDALGVSRVVEKPYGILEALRAFRKGVLAS